ncbi:MAG: DUF533 domain-containing protein, partial [Acidobacteria bacterium]
PAGDAAPAGDAPSLDAVVPPSLTCAVVRTMVAAALADGDFADGERRLIEGRLDESGLAAEDLAQVRRDMVLPPSPRELAALVTDAAGRELLYRFAAAVVLADRRVSELEETWLERLADAFGLSAERRAELRAEVAG